MAINRKLLRSAFTCKFGAEWSVTEAQTAEEALAALHPGHGFDLLVIDEHFGPGMRGSDVTRQLREREREAAAGEPRLMVVACTGSALTAEHVDHLRSCGADELWHKPFPNSNDGTMQRRLAQIIPRITCAAGGALE